MITCPECGQAAPDDAKFCDRCGQGLMKSAAPKVDYAIAALEPGTVMRGEFRILELIGRSALENRYRAERTRNGARPERVQLRERLGPTPADSAHPEGPAGTSGTEKISPDEDPTGPHAKTAELKHAGSPPPPRDADGTMARAANVSTCDESGERAATLAGSNGANAASQRGIALGAHESVAAGNAGANNEGANNDVAQAPDATRSSAPTAPLTLDETMGQSESEQVAQPRRAPAPATDQPMAREDLGELFGRVLALSLTVNHPAFQRAVGGFAEGGRVYLVYPDEQFTALAQRRGGLKMNEGEAVAVAIQVCQAVSFLNRRGLRLNDICPQSIAYGPGGRVKLLGLDYVSNDTELQSEPIFNDGYTAPEIYRNKKADKRADVFSAGALLYTWLTGERIPSESWREEAGPVRFYPPHVVTPRLEQAIRRAIAFNPADRWPNIDEFKTELIQLGNSIRLHAAAMTDVGRMREHNEDSVMALEYSRESMIEPSASYLYVVADGVGGAEAGEIASAIAVQAIRGYVESGLSSSTKGGGVAELLAAALEEANSKIIEYVASRPESRGMGSTGVCALIMPPDAAVAWVGDSRAYLLDGQTLRQLTKDHSLVQRLVEIGQITSEEARTHEHKNVITRSLGARQSGPAGAESVSLKLKRGDKLILCSDGLSDCVEDNHIRDILARHHDPYEAARELIVAANAGGGKDNISVVVVFAS